MIQFNLLPDIKIQYLKANRQKQVVLLVSVIATAASIVFLVVMGVIVFGLQKKSIKDLSADIKTSSAELQNTPDLTKILTVQNQLKSLPSLHDNKPVANRLFGYISQSTPSNASLSRVNVDFVKHTMTLTGSADSLNTVNTFTDTLKFTTYHTETNSKTEVQAFTDVVLSNFGRDSKSATYNITLTFDPVIFSELENVTLTIPSIVTTRSEIEQPQALFKKAEGAQ
jgi:hypothetical protein